MSTPLFPAPIQTGTNKRWALSDLLAYEAACRGDPKPDPLPPEGEVFFTTQQVCQRYQRSRMWLHRRKVEREALADA